MVGDGNNRETDENGETREPDGGAGVSTGDTPKQTQDASPEEQRTVIAPLPTRTQVGEGQVISNTYKIRRAIGKGGMARVFEAEHLASGTRHAVKIAHADLADDPEYVDLFKREVDLLRRVRHDGVVGYDGLLLDEAGTMYLVMEFVEGPSLEARLQDGPLTVACVRQIARCLSTALGAAHDKGVVHRDLSPDNIILRDGNLSDAVIIDFGIARDSQSSAKTVIGDRFAGKLQFAAPEQFGMNDWPVDRRADIYSLGLVLAAAAKGDPVDMGTTISGAVQRRMVNPDLSGLPQELAPAIGKMLQPDPSDRPATMADVCKLFQDVPSHGDDEGATRIVSLTGTDREAPQARSGGVTGLFDSVEPAARAEKPKLPLLGLGIGAAAVLVLAVGSYLALSGADTSEPPDPQITQIGEPQAPSAPPPPTPASTPEPAPPEPVYVEETDFEAPAGSFFCANLALIDGAPQRIKTDVAELCDVLAAIGARPDGASGALVDPGVSILMDGISPIVGVVFGASNNGYVYVDVLDANDILHHVMHGKRVADLVGSQPRTEPVLMNVGGASMPLSGAMSDMMKKAMMLDLPSGGPVLVSIMISPQPLFDRRPGYSSRHDHYLTRLRAAASTDGVTYSLHLLDGSAG